MANRREEILKFLGDIQSHYATYHNHKEISAWAGLVLYIGFLAQLVSAAETTIAGSCAMTVISIVVVLVAGISIGVFLCVQLTLRRKAASYVAACIYLRSKYLSEPGEEIEITKFAPRSGKDTRIDSDSCLPEIVLSEASDTKTIFLNLRTILEVCVYVVVLSVSVLAIARVWFTYTP